MVERAYPGTKFDRELKLAADRYVDFVGSQSADPKLRECLLRSAIFMLTKALEAEFDGHQKALVSALRFQAEIIEDSYY